MMTAEEVLEWLEDVIEENGPNADIAIDEDGLSIVVVDDPIHSRCEIGMADQPKMPGMSGAED